MEKIVIFILLSCCFLACELSPPPPKCVSNPPFDQLETFSKEYHAEVIKKLEKSKATDFRYFFKTFVESGEETNMILNLRNENQCFDVKMLVENWEKLGGMRKVNGKSYPKELVLLKWNIENRNDDKIVVYDDMNWIID
ncbi:MAG: hypothetical protein P1U56_01675 [Saprospiraceae bacterium]|nr:hypothetical protein [Saprospiraceae bacterium]